MRERLEDFYRELDAQYAQGDRVETERFLLEALHKALCKSKENAELLIAVYNELGSFYRGISRYAQSIAAFERARAFAASDLGEHSGQYATILNNMAGVYRLTGEYTRAIELFQKAAEVYRGEGWADSYAYASVLNNLALACRESGQLAQAVKYLGQALALLEKMPDQQQEVAITYNNLTALYSAQGEKNMAMLCLQRALQSFEKCEDEENVHYAAGLNSLAGFLFAEGDCDRALALYRKSARYTLRFFGENMDYGLTYQNLSWVYERMGRLEEAIAALEKAKKIYERLLGGEHEHTCAAADALCRLRRVSGT